jgi:hypothetical protein
MHHWSDELTGNVHSLVTVGRKRIKVQALLSPIYTVGDIKFAQKLIAI